MPEPYIFDIARASCEDGPGLRTVVFLKGCPLACRWCHNPESLKPGPEYFFNPADCIDCGNCREGKSCFTLARIPVGRRIPGDELLNLLLEDRTYYRASGGGVTFSGGEPCLYPDFLGSICRELKAREIHVNLETCGYFDWGEFREKVLDWVDSVYFDLKIIDPELHREFTGVSNKRILRNFTELAASGVTLLPRVPLVPGITATPENLEELASFMKAGGVRECEFLPYNPSGQEKWRRLGQEPPGGLPPGPLGADEQQSWIAFFRKAWQNVVPVSLKV